MNLKRQNLKSKRTYISDCWGKIWDKSCLPLNWCICSRERALLSTSRRGYARQLKLSLFALVWCHIFRLIKRRWLQSMQQRACRNLPGSTSLITSGLLQSSLCFFAWHFTTEGLGFWRTSSGASWWEPSICSIPRFISKITYVHYLLLFSVLHRGASVKLLVWLISCLC